MNIWELCIWKDKGASHFSLLESADHPRTEEEIVKAAVKGFDAIKAKLDRLKAGEAVIISGTAWMGPPPSDQADLIRAYCRRIGVEVR